MMEYGYYIQYGDRELGPYASIATVKAQISRIRVWLYWGGEIRVLKVRQEVVWTKIAEEVWEK